jgi:hypothetical protein
MEKETCLDDPLPEAPASAALPAIERKDPETVRCEQWHAKHGQELTPERRQKWIDTAEQYKTAIAKANGADPRFSDLF